MTTSPSPRPPLPPFDRSIAIQKVRLAEDAWTREPVTVATGYTPDSPGRTSLVGRQATRSMRSLSSSEPHSTTSVCSSSSAARRIVLK